MRWMCLYVYLFCFIYLLIFFCLFILILYLCEFLLLCYGFEIWKVTIFTVISFCCCYYYGWTGLLLPFFILSHTFFSVVMVYYRSCRCLLSAKHYSWSIECCNQSSRNKCCSFTYGYGECVIAGILVAAIRTSIPHFCNRNNPKTENGPRSTFYEVRGKEIETQEKKRAYTERERERHSELNNHENIQNRKFHQKMRRKKKHMKTRKQTGRNQRKIKHTHRCIVNGIFAVQCVLFARSFGRFFSRLCLRALVRSFARSFTRSLDYL